MSKKGPAIPVNQFGDESISIERLSFEDLPDLGEWQQPERHDRHTFFLLEKGNVTMEIDFVRYPIRAPSLIYMHPDQVHRILGFSGVTVCAWAMNNEQLDPEHLRALEGLGPAAPVPLSAESFVLWSEAANLCIRIAQLYPALLRDQCNTLIGLLLATYIEGDTNDQFSRAELITKAFRALLAQHFTTLKRPAQYAERLNISTAYLNECVKATTGWPVSYHIQQRVMLEAKRLLFHSDRSVKEIAAALGYDDYPYFCRLFQKVVGVTAGAFKNHV